MAWWDWLDYWLTGADVLLYVVEAVAVVVGVVVGAYLFICRNPQTHFGIARDCELEGRLAAALKHYRLAARYGAGHVEGRVARQKAAELERRLRPG
jgi:hypothetical protein